MKKSTKIGISFLLLIIGSLLFVLPIILLDPFELLGSDFMWLPVIGIFLIFIGVAILLTALIPKKYRQSGPRDGWDRMRWRH